MTGIHQKPTHDNTPKPPAMQAQTTLSIPSFPSSPYSPVRSLNKLEAFFLSNALASLMLIRMRLDVLAAEAESEDDECVDEGSREEPSLDAASSGATSSDITSSDITSSDITSLDGITLDGGSSDDATPDTNYPDSNASRMKGLARAAYELEQLKNQFFMNVLEKDWGLAVAKLQALRHLVEMEGLDEILEARNEDMEEDEKPSHIVKLLIGLVASMMDPISIFETTIRGRRDSTNDDADLDINASEHTIRIKQLLHRASEYFLSLSTRRTTSVPLHLLVPQPPTLRQQLADAHSELATKTHILATKDYEILTLRKKLTASLYLQKAYYKFAEKYPGKKGRDALQGCLDEAKGVTKKMRERERLMAPGMPSRGPNGEIQHSAVRPWNPNERRGGIWGWFGRR